MPPAEHRAHEAVTGARTISLFELNTVIVSILIAFALSEILSSWGRLVESRNRVRRPSLYLGATGWLFFSLIIHWFNVSAYRDLEFERNYESLLFFLPSIFAAATAFILTPTLSSEGEIDLEKHYFSVSPWAFRTAATYTALGGLSHLLVREQQTTPSLVSLALTSVLILLSFSERTRLHQVALSFLGVMLLVNVVFGSR
ncbi:MAG: hypothetical protein AAF430_18345 [Myxococcota bacterium]